MHKSQRKPALSKKSLKINHFSIIGSDKDVVAKLRLHRTIWPIAPLKINQKTIYQKTVQN
ncbi:MAG: hypothetical protein LT067_07580 [Sulfurovum sp.]|nr:hypothetical protein [Sulfurovum sp.]